MKKKEFQIMMLQMASPMLLLICFFKWIFNNKTFKETISYELLRTLEELSHSKTS